MSFVINWLIMMQQQEHYGPKVHSIGAVNIGPSVMGIRFKDGVLIAADRSITYGGMLKHKNADRIWKLNDECAFGCSGEMADA